MLTHKSASQSNKVVNCNISNETATVQTIVHPIACKLQVINMSPWLQNKIFSKNIHLINIQLRDYLIKSFTKIKDTATPNPSSLKIWTFLEVIFFFSHSLCNQAATSSSNLKIIITMKLPTFVFLIILKKLKWKWKNKHTLTSTPNKTDIREIAQKIKTENK